MTTVFRNGNQAHAAKRELDQPAPTIMFGARSNKVEWMDKDLADDPAASGVRVTVEEAAVLQSYPPDWVYSRPAPTVVGTRRSSHGMLIGRQLDDDSRQDVGGHSGAVGKASHQLSGVRVTKEQGATLQSYPSHLREEELLTDLIALDLFAGTGWGVACRWLGIDEYGVDNMPEVVETRTANGMATIYHDVWTGLLDGIEGAIEVPGLSVYARDIINSYNTLIASPPCQTFSQAGAGSGRKALDQVIAAVRDKRYQDPVDLHKLGEETDPRTALVLTPLAYAYRDRPMYVVLEQVPPVLPVWEACAVELRELGYSVVTGILNAEQYGVPQTRKRAILIARRDGVEAVMPTPTHSKYYNRDPKKLDEGVLPWVSMAEALGWGTTSKPSYTVTGGGRETGGYEPFPTGARQGMSKAIEEGEFTPRELALNSNVRFGKGTTRDSDTPAPTITGGKDYEDRKWVLRSNYGTNGDPEKRGERSQDEPAATITSKADRNKWVARSSQSVAGKDRAERDIDQPAFTVTQNSDRVKFEQRPDWVGERPSKTISHNPVVPAPGQSQHNAEREQSTGKKVPGWQHPGADWRETSEDGTPDSVKLTVEEAGALQSFPAVRSEEDEWKWKDTPATTIAGDPRITAREHHYHGEQNSTSFRLELPEAETLQSYPPMVWKGTKGKQFLQIGNAVPPLLAAAVLSTLLPAKPDIE